MDFNFIALFFHRCMGKGLSMELSMEFFYTPWVGSSFHSHTGHGLVLKKMIMVAKYLELKNYLLS